MRSTPESRSRWAYSLAQLYVTVLVHLELLPCLCGTHLNTHKKCERWLKKHPKVHFHFIPTRSSWLNQIETWFSILQGQSLTGASFTSVEQLQEHIDAFIAAYNETAAPFAWTKKRVYQRRFKNRRITQL